MVPVKLLPLAVGFLELVLRFLGCVLIHARFRNGSAVEVIGAPLRRVCRSGPTIADGSTVIFEVEPGIDEFTLGGNK